MSRLFFVNAAPEFPVTLAVVLTVSVTMILLATRLEPVTAMG